LMKIATHVRDVFREIESKQQPADIAQPHAGFMCHHLAVA